MKLYQNKYPISDAAEYVIDYVYNNPSGENFYYQLVRLLDDAILCAYKDIKDVMLYAWRVNIPANLICVI